MANISRRITRKSLAAKRASAIKTIKAQSKEKIRQIKLEYSPDAQKKRDRALLRSQNKELRAQRENARLAYNERQPRPYSLGEDLYSSISNGIGAGLSAAAIVLLCINVYFHSPEAHLASYTAAFALFGSGLFVLHLTVTLYHAITAQGARKVFAVLERCAAYFYAATLYLPFLVAGYRGGSPAAPVAVVCCVCGILCALYAVFSAKLSSFAVFSYVVIGAVLFALIFSGRVSAGVVGDRFVLFAAGAYILALVCSLFRTLKWMHAVFHTFVIGANVLLFFAVYNLV